MAAQGQRTAPLVPRKIISFTGKEAEFHHNVLDKELSDNNAFHDQLYIISIVGVCRSGKSFLINLMIKYLDYYSQHGNGDGWEESPMKITGVNWAKGRKQTVTRGVWCIIYPKLIRNIRVVLMDFQGTADKSQSTPTLDKMILFYSLKLSNLTMLNVVGQFDTNDLYTMGVCTLEKDGAQLHTDFEDLLFLVRDWSDEEEPESLEEIEKATDSPSVKKTAKTIRTSCRTVRTKGLPHPGRKVANATETQGLQICDIEKEFIIPCKELLDDLLVVSPIRSAKTKTGADFVYYFEMLSRDTVGKVLSPMEASVNSLITEAWNDAQKELENRVEVLKGTVPETEDEIEKVLDAALKEATKVYEADARVVKHASEERKREDLDGLKHLTDQALERLRSEFRQRKMEEEKVKLRAKMEAEKKKRLEEKARAKRLIEDRERMQRERDAMRAQKEMEKAERLKAEQERLKAKERLEKETERNRQEKEKLWAEMLKAEQESREREKRAKAESVKAEQERLIAEKRLNEKAERIRQEEEKLRTKRLKAEQERLEAEKRAKAEKLKAEQERLKAEKRLEKEAERIRQEEEKGKAERLKAEQKRQQAEKREAELKRKREEELSKQKQQESGFFAKIAGKVVGAVAAVVRFFRGFFWT